MIVVRCDSGSFVGVLSAAAQMLLVEVAMSAVVASPVFLPVAVVVVVPRMARWHATSSSPSMAFPERVEVHLWVDEDAVRLDPLGSSVVNGIPFQDRSDEQLSSWVPHVK